MLTIVLLASAHPVAARAADMTRAPVAMPPALQPCGAAAPGFMLPGLDTCLRLGGTVEVEAATHFAEPAFALAGRHGLPGTGPAHAPPLSAIGARALLRADVRTQTAYGPLRVYVSIRAPQRIEPR